MLIKNPPLPGPSGCILMMLQVDYSVKSLYALFTVISVITAFYPLLTMHLSSFVSISLISIHAGIYALFSLNPDQIKAIVEVEVANYVKSYEFVSMLESIKRKEREYAIAEAKKQLKQEQRYIATYGGSELLSMEDDDTKDERVASTVVEGERKLIRSQK